MKSPLPQRSTSRGQDRISMTPMIDIVFLLIIFFLVSSHLSRQENRHPVMLAQAAGGELGDVDLAPLTLTLDAAGKFFFGSELVPIENLPDRLIAYRQSRTRSPHSTSVRLRIDRAIPYGDVEPILKELAEQGVANVAIVVSPRDRQSPQVSTP